MWITYSMNFYHFGGINVGNCYVLPTCLNNKNAPSQVVHLQNYCSMLLYDLKENHYLVYIGPVENVIYTHCSLCLNFWNLTHVVKLKFTGFFTFFCFSVIISGVLVTHLAFEKFKWSAWITLTCNVH